MICFGFFPGSNQSMACLARPRRRGGGARARMGVRAAAVGDTKKSRGNLEGRSWGTKQRASNLASNAQEQDGTSQFEACSRAFKQVEKRDCGFFF